MADKAPAEKLPLAVRKNVRDEWEKKKADFETELATLLGTPWTIDINPLALYPYAEEKSWASNSLGNVISSYIDGLIYQLKRYLESHKTAGKDELNIVCPTHSIVLLPSTTCSYCGVKVDGGRLCLLFGPTYLGTNVNDAAYELANAVSSAPQPTGAPSLSFAARHSIRADYDPHVTALLVKAAAALQNPTLKFEPGFDELGAMLKGGKGARDDWERNLGNFALQYYDAFVYVLEREKFGEDEMLREGFAEGVPDGIVKLKVVEKLKGGGYYNEIVLDGGAVAIQTTPEYWGSNISDAPSKLVDIL